MSLTLEDRLFIARVVTYAVRLIGYLVDGQMTRRNETRWAEEFESMASDPKEKE